MYKKSLFSQFYLTDLVITKDNYPPQGRWTALDIYLDASHLAI